MCRRLATAAHADPLSLPLAGIRVLDMTRVLAGVSSCYDLRPSHDMLNVRIAILYTDTWGPWVGVIMSSMLDPRLD